MHTPADGNVKPPEGASPDDACTCNCKGTKSALEADPERATYATTQLATHYDIGGDQPQK